MIKINKAQARKLYYNGLTIHLIQCKCIIDSTGFNQPVEISLLDLEENPTLPDTFDKRVNNYEFYNCNNELGKYTHFYVREKDYESYRMCMRMC